MLTNFAVTNYRGFANRIELNLSNHSNYSFNTFAIKNEVIKNGIIYGPNGSGKSNLGLALFDLVNHLTQKWKKGNYYTNFVFAGNSKSPVKFEYSFKLGKYKIDYTYAKNSKGSLITEMMRVDGNEVFNRKGENFSIDDTYPMDDTIRKNLANNANNISVVNFLLTSYPLPKDHYLILLQNFANSMLWFKSLDVREFIGLETKNINLDEYIIQNHLTTDFQEFIEKVSDQHFSFAESSDSDKELYCIYGNSKIVFDQIASTGTHSLMLLYYWIKQMDKASFVFIDEFDAFYHFKLSFAVCQQLFALDCQAFTSSHNTYLMTNDLLRPDCNFILNENKVKPLNECTEKELRFGHNIEKMFRGGTFAI